MKRLGVLTLAALVAIAAVVGVASFTDEGTSRAHAVQNERRLITGIATTDALVSTYWHGSAPISIDLVKTVEPTGGANVYWQSHWVSGPDAMSILVIQDFSGCKATRVRTAHILNDLGDYWFYHVDNTPAIGASWTAAGTGWTFRHVGTIAWSDAAGCDWFGPHLHQGGDTTSSELTHNTTIQNNAAWHDRCDDDDFPGVDCQLNPTGNYSALWLHRYKY